MSSTNINKKILVIGSGGREHALVKALKASPQVSEVLAAPGSPGIAQDATCYDIAATDFDALMELAKSQQVAFTLVGPEAPLVDGIVDAFQKAGLKIFGPSKAAAQLEGSKAFSKDFLRKYKIPTALYEVFHDLEAAKKFVESNTDTEWVVKVDGLAAGKGVYVSRTTKATLQALEEIFLNVRFGKQAVVIEEFLAGEELSFMALCDGENALPLASSQDHKRLLNGDEGPNTGGMGAYSPAPLLTPELESELIETVLKPTLAGMKSEGAAFAGILYAGVMVVDGKPYVLEYNVRFGDPEAQVILPRLKSDWVELFEAGISGRLDQVTAQWTNESAAVVVLAAENYPASPRKGDKISGLDEATKLATVYFAGVGGKENDWLTAGGRVLGITALGESLALALQRAYEAVGKIAFSGMHYRSDIGQRGLASQHS